MKIIVYDIETFLGFFLFCGLDIQTGERFVFTVEDLDKMIRFIEDHRGYYFVGYNNLRFDGQVIEYIVRNNRLWYNLTPEQLLVKIHSFAQEVIQGQEYEEYPPYRERDLSFRQIDLMRIHHFDNQNRRCKLKWIAFMIDVDNIEELPYEHYKDGFTKEEKEKTIKYCWNDVEVTLKFYQYTIGETEHEFYQGKNKISDRLGIIENLNFPLETINYSNVKIGDEINKRTYCQIKGIDERQLKEIRKSRKPTRKITFGACIPDYVQFKTSELQQFKEQMSQVRVNLNKQEKEFPLSFRGVKYVIGQGGIHTVDPARIIRPRASEILRDVDVGSQHPTAIIKRKLFPDHLGPEWLVGYESQRSTRAVYKEKGKTDRMYKGLSDTYKDALNGGGFGKTVEKTNWQYGPEVGFACTIGNQFEILLLIERLEMAGIKVMSANTDGVICLFDRSLEEVYNQVCSGWEITVGNTGDMGRLEFADYRLLAQESINHYIAVEVSGKVKIKGRLVTDCEVHKNNTKDLGRIERKAVCNYFAKGTPVEETIRSSRNIFDFCIGVKSTRDYHYEMVGVSKVAERHKQIVRFYISREGHKLLKVKNEEAEGNGAEITRIVDGSLVTIFNQKVVKPWDEYKIDYDYYIASAKQMVRKIEGHSYADPSQISMF